MAMYKEHERKPLPLYDRPNLATPEDLGIELGTIIAFIRKTKEAIEKAEAARLSGGVRLDADVIKAARAVQGRLDVLKTVIDRYQAALDRNQKKKK